MALDFQKFYEACDPTRTLVMGNPEDRQYYIDFASVRGGKIIEALGRTITRLSPDRPTCQMFTGHLGCGKSTELRRLETELKEQRLHVVFFSATKDLEMVDVDITDILLAIAYEVTKSLETTGISLRPGYFVNLFNEIKEILQTPVEISNVGFSVGIAKITAQTKDSPKLRSRLRQHLEPRTNDIVQAINEELLGRANDELKRQGKKGLVVIIDDLDRVDPRPMPSGRTQPEYLFIDRGEQLRKLNCHVVYTIPLALLFSKESEILKQHLGGGVAPKVLPMVPIQLRDGTDNQEGMALLRQMVLTRAFPEVDANQRVDLITQVFDSSKTLDRLCRVSGGRVRNLLGLLYRCLQEENPPLSRDLLESVIRLDRDRLVLGIEDPEWDLLLQVVQRQSVSGKAAFQTLLRSLFVFEYRDREGSWFGINPALAESEKFKSLQKRKESNHG